MKTLSRPSRALVLFVSLGAGAALCGAEARAEPPPSVHFGLQGGYQWTSSDLDLLGQRDQVVSLDSGAYVGLYAGLLPTDLFGFELHVGLEPLSDTTGTRAAYVLPAHVDGVVFFLRGDVEPFARLGVGALALVGGDLGTDLDLLLTGAVGLRVRAAGPVAVRATAEVGASDGVSGALAFNALLTLGVEMMAGGGPAESAVVRSLRGDRDGDGVADGLDACPTRPGPASAEGCPDTDHDGLNDGDDVCPDHRGELAFEGCPDTDRDGVADMTDPCPTRPGRRGGCPDRDHDGLADARDACPNAPGGADRYGCPQGGGIAELRDGVLSGITWAPGETRLSPATTSALAALVQALRADPTARAELRVHVGAPSGEQAARALDLSERRAAALAAALVRLGLDAWRVRVVGMGAMEPGEPPDRVELHVRH